MVAVEKAKVKASIIVYSMALLLSLKKDVLTLKETGLCSCGHGADG